MKLLIKSFAEAKGSCHHNANGKERHGDDVELDHFETDAFEQQRADDNEVIAQGHQIGKPAQDRRHGVEWKEKTG